MPITVHRRHGNTSVITLCAVVLTMLVLHQPVQAKTAYQFLLEAPAPNFRPGYTLPRLAHWSGSMTYEFRVISCDRWGYAMEFGRFPDAAGVKLLDDPNSVESRVCALSKSDPQKYPLYVLVNRPMLNPTYTSTLPESTWCHDAAGTRLGAYNPLMPDSTIQKIANDMATPLARIQQAAPIAIVLNGGEYGIGVYGASGSKWVQDPTLVAAKGTRSWYDFISERKAHFEEIVLNAVKAQAPTMQVYAFYFADGPPDRNRYADYWQWVWDYAYMRKATIQPNSSLYYLEANTGWTGTIDLLTQSLNAIGQEISFGDRLSYNWVCSGWLDGMFSDDARYYGYLKCLYTAGMIGGVAGYFSYPPNGFQADQGTTAPSWVTQYMTLGYVHALFSHVEDFLRNGDLLPGPNMHRWSTNLPAYEFPTGDATARVLARKHRTRAEWLICAWAAGGADRNVTVTIPTLGTVTVLARACGTLYRAKPGPVLIQLDTNPTNPSSGLRDITATSGPNGTIAPSGYIAVPTGGSESFTFTPNTGYVVADVVVDGISLGARPSYAFTNVTANHSIQVTFTSATPTQFTLSVQSQPAGVSIGGTPAGVTSYSAPVAANSTVNLTAPAKTAMADISYAFARWRRAGVDQPAGQTTLSFTATGNTTVEAIYDAVSTINVPPTANSLTITTAEDTAKVVTLTGADSDGDALTYTVATQPAHGTLTGTVPNLTYTPAANYNGTDSFTFTVNDGMATSTPATVSITITPVNDVPLANKQTVSTPEDTALALTLTGSDLDGDALTYTVATQPAHGTLIGTAPNMTYTPAANYNGGDSFTFTVNDGKATSVPATVTITVTPVNDLPTANSLTITTAEDTAKVITLTGADSDGDALTYTVATQPAHGTLTGTAPNLTYTPAANYNGGDSFTFTVNDGKATSVPATVTITVTPVNDAPKANSLTITTVEDTAKVVTLTGADSDGDALTYTVATQPAHGTLTGTAPNLTYTPAVNYNGGDSFTFTVNDGKATSVPATVTITVTPVNDAPSANAKSVATNINTPVNITLTGSDPDGDALTYALASSPSHGTLTGTAPNLQYTPAAGYYGLDSFTFTARDGSTTSLPGMVTITMRGVRPDLLIRNSSETIFLGDGVYNTTGTGQSKTQGANIGLPAKFDFLVQNDGSVADQIKITATAGTTAWTVTYYDSNGSNITTQITSSTGWMVGPVNPGAGVGFYASVVPTTTVRFNSSYVLTVTATSMTDTTCADVVSATTRRMQCQPDLFICSTDMAFVGTNIYSADGTGETKAQIVKPGVTATYYVHIQNDGKTNDRIVVTAPTGGNGWQVQYLDDFKRDITGTITSASGWQSKYLQPGKYQTIRIRVTPQSGISPGAVLSLLIQGRSLTDMSRMDAVKATVTSQ